MSESVESMTESVSAEDFFSFLESTTTLLSIWSECWLQKCVNAHLQRNVFCTGQEKCSRDHPATPSNSLLIFINVCNQVCPIAVVKLISLYFCILSYPTAATRIVSYLHIAFVNEHSLARKISICQYIYIYIHIVGEKP